jgi:hypothetical protein
MLGKRLYAFGNGERDAIDEYRLLADVGDEVLRSCQPYTRIVKRKAVAEC